MGVKRYDRHSAAIIRTPRWKALRVIAKRRDGWKCVQCGASGDLEVDHIEPVRTRPDLAYELSNLQTLCVRCHSRKTRIEVGMAEIDPKRQAWRDLVHELSKRKETPCLRA
jgi:5-methylcytosine-specific restriction endonuclease McrA